jgi:hypothetical protein
MASDMPMVAIATIATNTLTPLLGSSHVLLCQPWKLVKKTSHNFWWHSPSPTCTGNPAVGNSSRQADTKVLEGNGHTLGQHTPRGVQEPWDDEEIVVVLELGIDSVVEAQV